MHKIQEELLRVAQSKNLGQYTLREIGAFIGEQSPQKIKHHLLQLEKRGLLKIDKIKGVIEKKHQEWIKEKGRSRILSVPILGAVNAGPAQIFAETNIEGFLKISSSLLNRSVAKGEHQLFALKVEGVSMNRAEVGKDKKRIENGDYVVIDLNDRNPKNGDIVLSVIDGVANIKEFHLDRANRQIVLMSRSTQEFPPIYIHENDNFFINGKVVQVIKKPRGR